MLKYYFKFFIIATNLMLGMCCLPIHAEKVDYWGLSPDICLGTNESHLYNYSARVLINKKTENFVELLLHIRDSQDPQKFTQAWVKRRIDDNNMLELYSLGDEVVLGIDPFQPENSIIIGSKTGPEGLLVEASWLYADEKSWIISNTPQPSADTCLNLDGIDYFIYSGEIVYSHYTTWIYENLDFHRWMYHKVDIDIKIKGEETQHYVDRREDAAYISNPNSLIRRSPEGFDDNILKMLRKWEGSDEIKILINRYYPGFWWIMNESRYEAVFVAHGKAQKFDYDLWHRLTN